MWRRRTGWVLVLWVVLVLVGCQQERIPIMPGHGEVLWQETFPAGETGRWLIEGDDAGQAAIINEQMLIEVNAPNTVHYVTLEEPTFADFLLEVDVTQVAGAADSSYGVLFRIAGPGQFYRFDVRGDGMFVVERHEGGDTWTRLTDGWLPATPAVQEGLNVTNRLGVIAEGTTLSFYANEQLLTQLTDDAYRQGRIALDAGTFARPGVQVVFDNLVVSRP